MADSTRDARVEGTGESLETVESKLNDMLDKAEQAGEPCGQDTSS